MRNKATTGTMTATMTGTESAGTITIMSTKITMNMMITMSMKITGIITGTGSIITTVITMKEIRLALPVTNPLAHFDSLTLDQVAKEEFICLQKGKNLRSITDAYCKMAGFDPNVVLESDSPETVRELIRAGIGISFIPILTWQDMEDQHIALVPISTPHCRRYINLSWRESSYLFYRFLMDGMG